MRPRLRAIRCLFLPCRRLPLLRPCSSERPQESQNRRAAWLNLATGGSTLGVLPVEGSLTRMDGCLSFSVDGWVLPLRQNSPSRPRQRTVLELP